MKFHYDGDNLMFLDEGIRERETISGTNIG